MSSGITKVGVLLWNSGQQCPCLLFRLILDASDCGEGRQMQCWGYQEITRGLVPWPVRFWEDLRHDVKRGYKSLESKNRTCILLEIFRNLGKWEATQVSWVSCFTEVTLEKAKDTLNMSGRKQPIVTLHPMLGVKMPGPQLGALDVWKTTVLFIFIFILDSK